MALKKKKVGCEINSDLCFLFHKTFKQNGRKRRGGGRECTLDKVQSQNDVVICGDSEKITLIQKSPETTTKVPLENIPSV